MESRIRQGSIYSFHLVGDVFELGVRHLGILLAPKHAAAIFLKWFWVTTKRVLLAGFPLLHRLSSLLKQMEGPSRRTYTNLT